VSAENVQIVREILDGIARRDAEAVSARYHPEIELDQSENPVPGLKGVYHGIDGVRKWWRRWADSWEGIEYDDEELLDAGDQVVYLVARGRVRGRASSIEIGQDPFALVWTLRDGLVVRLKLYTDHHRALAAAGLTTSS
jgi:ketosteroid isomerase-like protein